MLTRTMAESIQHQIEELSALIEDQRLQLETLQAARQPALPQRNEQSETLARGTRHFDGLSVPDPIKIIPNYAGEPKLLIPWIDSVDQKLTYCKNLIGDPAAVAIAMPLWTGIIRDRIINEANDVLIRNQTRLDWEEIKNDLREELGDKRDLATLCSKISQLKQSYNQDLTLFYNECKKLLADINAKLLINDETASCAKILMKNYETMIVNAFIDGLSENLSSLTRIYRPKQLSEAYQCALEQHNAIQRRRDKFTFRNNNPPFRPTIPSQPYLQRSSPGNNRPGFPQQQYRPGFRPQVPYQQRLAIKQEPSSQQTRTPHSQNVNCHEALVTENDPVSDHIISMDENNESGSVEELNFQSGCDNQTGN